MLEILILQNSKHGHHTSESLVNSDAILNIITRCRKEDITKDDLALQFEKLDSACEQWHGKLFWE